MRPDMHKVVTTRPRYRGGIPKGRKANIPLDALPRNEGMRKKWAVNQKEFSDLIGPLMRYLRKSAGQPWDTVYSDIVNNLPKGIHRRHILIHVESAVKTNIFMSGNVPCRSGRFHGTRLRRGDLYVNPDTGILCIVP